MTDTATPERHLWTRRRLLVAAGAGAAGSLTASLLGHNFIGSVLSATPPATHRYWTRPDLRPPVITVTTKAMHTSAGYLLSTPNSTTTSGSMISDNQGHPIWYQPSNGTPTANLQVQSYLGAPVLTWWEGQVNSGVGTGEYVIMDGSYREIRRVRAGNGYHGDLHEFLITPAGTALLTVYNQVMTDLTSVGGPKRGAVLDSLIQEVDLQSGQVLFEWHSLDHVKVDHSHSRINAQPGAPYDYFHVNSVDVDHDGHLLVSARNTWAIYKIHRLSGAVIWRLGGKKTDFALGDDVQFAWQHDARRQPDGTLTLFDDGAAPAVEPQSRGLALELDEIAKTAKVKREYAHPSRLLVGSQGNTQALPNGNVLIGWGAEPYVSEFSADGHVLFDARLPNGLYSYRTFRQPWIGRPTNQPAIAARFESSGQATVFASWNGATEISRWQVLNGPSASQLSPLAAARNAGFETAITVNRRAPFLAVRALDASGALLGTSSSIRL
jgi:arylsulfotransferase ASST